MILTSEARAARKDLHLKRLEAKEGGGDYAEFYANQAIQRAKSAINELIAEGRREARAAREAISLAVATGEGLEAAQSALENATIKLAAAESKKAQRFPKGRAVALTLEGQ